MFLSDRVCLEAARKKFKTFEMHSFENPLKCVDNWSFRFFFVNAILNPTHLNELDQNLNLFHEIDVPTRFMNLVFLSAQKPFKFKVNDIFQLITKLLLR